MKQNKKNVEGKPPYVAPAIEVIRVENEGIMASSTGGNLEEMPGIGWIDNTTSSRSSNNRSLQSASPLQEIEDLLNDILTVRK